MDGGCKNQTRQDICCSDDSMGSYLINSIKTLDLSGSPPGPGDKCGCGRCPLVFSSSML